MCHESLCCQYGPAVKCQSMQWKTSVSVRQNRHMSPAHVKAVLICFLIIRALFVLSSFDKESEPALLLWKYWQYYLRLFIGEDLNLAWCLDRASQQCLS